MNALLVQRLLLLERESSTWVQIQDKAVWVSFPNAKLKNVISIFLLIFDHFLLFCLIMLQLIVIFYNS